MILFPFLIADMFALTQCQKVLRSFFKSYLLRPQAHRRFSFCELFAPFGTKTKSEFEF